MSINECPKLQKKLDKGDGGAIDLIEDEDRLRKRMFCGPAIARNAMGFEENSVLKQTRKTEYRHISIDNW